MRVYGLLWLGACSDPHEVGRSGLSLPEMVPVELELDGPPSVPLMGGTLESMPALDAVLASLPERDQVVMVQVGEEILTEFREGSVPFRLLVEEELAWVTLRGTGEVALLEPASSTVLWKTPICRDPRGITRANDSVLVACAGGELVEVDDEGKVLRSELLMPDLRDVVLEDGALFVSRFRSAEVLVLDPVTWEVQHQVGFTGGGMAWRMRPAPDQGVMLVFQVRQDRELSTSGYMGGQCDGPSQGSIGTVDPDGVVVQGAVFQSVSLPVDFVLWQNDSLILADGADANQLALSYYPYDIVLGLQDICLVNGFIPLDAVGSLPSGLAVHEGEIMLHSTQPNQIQGMDFLWREGQSMGSERSFHLFHEDPGGGISCASCHPEGTDDGRVWRFADMEIPMRRTLTLAGGVSQRAPFHWRGEHDDSRALMQDTFEVRMNGYLVPEREIEDLFSWLDGIRPVRATVLDQDAVTRGQAVFEASGCADCHAGTQYTNHQVVAVRGQRPTKVPTLLGLGLQHRLMHDGCATSIEDRLLGDDDCTGGAQHGDLTGRTPEELSDLAAFLRSL